MDMHDATIPDARMHKCPSHMDENTGTHNTEALQTYQHFPQGNLFSSADIIMEPLWRLDVVQLLYQRLPNLRKQPIPATWHDATR